MAQLSLRGVRKVFRDTEVLRGIDLDIGDRELVVFVGPSGCGKSTLLRLIAGLDQITSGEFHLNGRSMNAVAPSKRGIAMVFQSYALYPHMDVYENMAFGARLMGLDKAEVEARIAEAARMLKLAELLKRKPRELSGGQRQRVAFGRALVRKPEVFLLDEPLSNLDAALRVGMRLEISELHERLKTTMIYVTHDQVEAMTLAQRVMVMNKGIAEQIGTPVEVYEKPATRFVASFIGSPAMNLLEGRISSAGTHFELESGMALPINWYYRGYAGRKMTLGIRPEHIGLTSQADGGVPLVMDTLEMLGADNLAHGRWGEQKMVVRLAHQERPKAGSTLWLHLPENHLHLFDGETGQRV
jgi:sn-glycerol 3-phosphate transport system ATP-binding protein